MKQHATFYHAGCPVCVDAEQSLAASLDPARFEVEIVHLGEFPARVSEAEQAGVKKRPRHRPRRRRLSHQSRRRPQRAEVK